MESTFPSVSGLSHIVFIYLLVIIDIVGFQDTSSLEGLGEVFRYDHALLAILAQVIGQ